jgi:hypothetical protein
MFKSIIDWLYTIIFFLNNAFAKNKIKIDYIFFIRLRKTNLKKENISQYKKYVYIKLCLFTIYSIICSLCTIVFLLI